MARFIHHGLKFRKEIMHGTLPKDKDKNGKAWSMTQYKYMFNACRMPGGGTNDADTLITYAEDIYTHICVVRKNNFYVFDVCDKDGNPFSVDVIEKQLNRVKSLADNRGYDKFPVGILTAQDRKPWANSRKLLLSNTTNEDSLKKIQSSTFLICLDDKSPVYRNEIGKSLLHGDGGNRFWDKSIQMVIFENGKMGYLGEHSMMDGTTTTRFVNETLDLMSKDPESKQFYNKSIDDNKKPYNSNTILNEPEYLSFNLSNDAKKSIKNAELWFDQMQNTKELSVLHYQGYGSNKIKGFKNSPDAYAQLAIQLAYRKTFGHCRGTYESTATRRFLHGRTEVTRSVSNESEAFINAVENSEPYVVLYDKLLQATKAHSGYIKKASQAQGCDRHLFGLKMLVKSNEQMPELFSDPGYTRSCHWAISSSGLVGENMDGWGKN